MGIIQTLKSGIFSRYSELKKQYKIAMDGILRPRTSFRTAQKDSWNE